MSSFWVDHGVGIEGTPMEHPHRTHHGGHVDDAQLGRIVAMGTIIGLPLVFCVSTLLALQVGMGNALTIAVLPTLFSGSFVGGLILLIRAQRRAERAAALAAVAVAASAGEGRRPRR
jgi:hypothetical protein